MYDMKDINPDLASSEITTHIIPTVCDSNQYTTMYTINGTPINKTPILTIKNAGELAQPFIQTILDKLNNGESLETILSELN